jgi:poly(A) polymerase
VTGDDLVALGMRPGPAFKPLLDRAYDLQLNGGVGSRADALAAVRSWVDGLGA